ncbi:MAG: SUMF1/EgtB/PvdO family nonheme iron enzyme [bacterium]
MSALSCFSSDKTGTRTKDFSQLENQKNILLSRIKHVHNLSDSQFTALSAIFKKAVYISQGNPLITKHPVSCEECLKKISHDETIFTNKRNKEICGSQYMSPLYDPETQEAEQAEACIDQFEFPNIPCEYPLVWVRACEAARICEILGKRLCDAHEWEGACEGRLLEPDYRFDLARGKSPSAAVNAMRNAHNRKCASKKLWAYGSAYERGRCACASFKQSQCTGGSWDLCGSNTYPAGYFPECKSQLGVYDLHGNAAEHMNLPLNEQQMASRGSREYGVTEMKGSWFIFDHTYAHEDWCRWRAPYWHGSLVIDPNSHHNYHLGFRCCKTLKKNAEKK